MLGPAARLDPCNDVWWCCFASLPPVPRISDRAISRRGAYKTYTKRLNRMRTSECRMIGNESMDWEIWWLPQSLHRSTQQLLNSRISWFIFAHGFWGMVSQLELGIRDEPLRAPTLAAGSRELDMGSACWLFPPLIFWPVWENGKHSLIHGKMDSRSKSRPLRYRDRGHVILCYVIFSPKTNEYVSLCLCIDSKVQEVFK